MSAETESERHAVLSARETGLRWLPLVAAGGAAWVITVTRGRAMGAGPGTMGMTLPIFTWMWGAMMAAMMLPAIGPVAAREVSLGAGTRASGRTPGVLAFGFGFLVPWAAYGLLAYVALLGAGRLTDSSPATAKWLGVAIFAVAGVYQMTRWKLWALEHCRMTMHGRGRPGLGTDFSLGVRDGWICVGCCWALMATLVAVGVMNLAGIVGLATLIFAEKVLPRPRLVASVAGIVLLAVAIAAAVHPSFLSGLTPHLTEMGGI